MADNADLLQRIEELERWKSERELQQLTFPLDNVSLEILRKYFMHITDTLTTIGGAAGNEFTNFIGKQDKNEFIVEENAYIPYTANATANTISGAFGNPYDNDQIVNFVTTGTLPAGLTSGDFYVINGTATTFQVSLTLGGVAVDITDTGTGRQFMSSVGF